MNNASNTTAIRAPPTAPPTISPMTWLPSSSDAGAAVGLPAVGVARDGEGKGDSRGEDAVGGDGVREKPLGDPVTENDGCVDVDISSDGDDEIGPVIEDDGCVDDEISRDDNGMDDSVIEDKACVDGVSRDDDEMNSVIEDDICTDETSIDDDGVSDSAGDDGMIGSVACDVVLSTEGEATLMS